MPAPPVRYKAGLIFLGVSSARHVRAGLGSVLACSDTQPRHEGSTPGLHAASKGLCGHFEKAFGPWRGGASRRRGAGCRISDDIYRFSNPVRGLVPEFRHPSNSNGTRGATLSPFRGIFRMHRLGRVFLSKTRSKRAKHAVSGWFGRHFVSGGG